MNEFGKQNPKTNKDHSNRIYNITSYSYVVFHMYKEESF